LIQYKYVSGKSDKSFMSEGQKLSHISVDARIDWKPLGLVLLILACLTYIFWDGLDYMVSYWGRKEEYNHGYLIPVVAFYLLWLRAEEISQSDLVESWAGLLIIIGAVVASAIGKVSGTFQVVEYGFLLALLGLIVTTGGWRGLRLTSVPFVYLLFMIPLPFWLYQSLSGQLQLISSELGVAVIRFFGVSVFLEGNVIDLGTYQLEVAEACSGLRYLFPLMSFGFLCAAIYKGPRWQQVIIFVSAIPLTILMNSFRIGVIGILVDNFGIGQAEGFLHYFEGWIVFMTCVVALFLLMWLFARFRGLALMEVFALDIPSTSTLKYFLPRSIQPQVLGAIVISVIGVVVAYSLKSYEDHIPDRMNFATFPLVIDDWRGKDSIIEDTKVLNTLSADDYFLGQYWHTEWGTSVGLWVAYYEEQRQGNAVHSPKACLPGGGWDIGSLGNHVIENIGPNGESYKINRVLMTKGNMRQLVYYWFVERGRIQYDEFQVKWYIFWDALTRNRTDGALVRVSTFVPDITQLDEAEQRLTEFVRVLDPKLAFYLPQEDATFEQVKVGMVKNSNL
jgi:exosortase D (VPLPA-CTERM-specific)